MHREGPAPRGPATTDQPAPSSTITANVMHVFIQALQKTSGRQFESLLTAAGLERYAHTLPPADWSPAATADELVRLNRTVYAMLGEQLTRLFHRNCGEAIVPGVLASAWGAQARTVLPTLPPDQRLAWFVRAAASMAERGWGHHTLTEDAIAWYLTAAFCPTCVGITGVSAPLCAQSPALFAGLAREVLGRRVRVVEVECVALGHSACKYAFYK
jgi:bacteriochlorophyll 4-vinyl reductase